MTQPKDNQQSAFPHQKEDGTPCCGITLRDWFAGHALAGIASTDGSATHIADARNAYLWADAMLEARK